METVQETPKDEGDQHRFKLESVLENLIETLRQGVIITEEFQQESQPILNSKLNSIIDQLKVLNDLAPHFEHERIPNDILE
jgi:hypothetical protein